jgi:prepilin signal peptidase PulO-like enzyme (type II secretory pathway)
MSCRNTLCWYELIPLLSFCALGGRCRNCKTKISIQYPLVELVSGFIFVGIFLKFQDIFFTDTIVFAITYAYYTVLFSLLLVISAYDIRHKVIPDTLALVFGMCAFLGLFIFNASGFFPHIPTLWEFLSGVFLSLPFALMWLLSRGTWMGLGDAKLAVGLGFLLGPAKILTGAVLAFWSGAIIGLCLVIFSRKYKIKSEIPFAPFLILGTILAFFFELNIFQISF